MTKRGEYASLYKPSDEVLDIFHRHGIDPYSLQQCEYRGAQNREKAYRECQIDLIRHYLPTMSPEDRERALNTLELIA